MGEEAFLPKAAMDIHFRKLSFSSISDQKPYPPCYMCYICPDECYSLSSPPLPPPPSPEQKQNMSTILIAMLCILGAALLFLSYFTIIRFRAKLRRARNPTPGFAEDFADANRGPVPIHPIWHIRTVGLPQSAIDSISIYRYVRGEGVIEGTDCSICLNEFRENEDLRLLPKCSHAFHVPCIDEWLRSQKNCPVCRSPILSNAVANAAAANAAASDVTMDSESVSENPTGISNRPERETAETMTPEKAGDDEWRFRNRWGVLRVNMRVVSDLTDRNRKSSFPARRSASMDNFPSSSVTVHQQKQRQKEDEEEETSSSNRDQNNGFFIGRELNNTIQSITEEKLFSD